MQKSREKPIHPWVLAESQKVRAGVCFLDPCADWQRYYACVQEAEELNYDSLWVADHPAVMSDCWSVLTSLAVTTRRIRLGSLVSCVYYRNPALLARLSADVDRLSKGRLVLGLGIGDRPPEFASLGLPFPGVRERQEKLEEVILAVQETWKKLPLGPVQQPHVPLLIAGGGTRTLFQVARYADVSNFGPNEDTGGVSHAEDALSKCRILDTHCATVGRERQSILRTHVTLPLVLGRSSEEVHARQEAVPPPLRARFASSTLAVTPDEAIAHYRKLVAAGLRYFILGIWPGDVETVRLFSQQVLPCLNG